MVTHWSPCDIKYPQVSKIILRILADLSNAVVWIFSARPSMSNSNSPLTKPFWTVPSAPIIIAIGVTFLSDKFF